MQDAMPSLSALQTCNIAGCARPPPAPAPTTGGPMQRPIAASLAPSRPGRSRPGRATCPASRRDIVAASSRKDAPEQFPLDEEECAAYERVNKTFPPSPLLKQALSVEERLIAVLSRSFEIIAVAVMTIYAIKALEIALYDTPAFVTFFFEGGAPNPENSKAFDETFIRIRESLGQGILIGLEFLIISDILESVGKPLEERTLQDLLKLGLVVIIRTVIDLSLHVGAEGGAHSM
mmetsp:Transcript_36365/g.91833  ORF Transcript_36365/g.91833 Transcript_36365/m.91833 type:complete len:234 (-) Transcript_36365:2492-3193(-)